MPTNDRTLYIGNLHPETTGDSLHEFLSGHVDVEEVALSYHGKTGEFQHFAYVRFKTRDDASKVKDSLHGRPFMKRPLWCDWSRPAPQRWEIWLDPDNAPGYE